MQTLLKRAVSVLVSAATLASMSGLALVAPLAAHAAVPSDYGLTEGNMISASGSNDPDVYIVNAFGYKRLFLNPVIFGFYGQLSGGWASVKSVSAAARDAFPTTQLFRNCETNAQAVYAVEVTGEDTATLHHVVMSGDAAVAQDSNFFKKVFCVNSRENNWYTMGSDYTSLSQIPPYVRGGVGSTSPTPTPVAGNGPVTASLSSDNPAAGTVIAAQGVADLAHFHLSNPSSSAVAVNSLKFQRLGISGDTTFANVYVYNLNPNARLTDAVTPSSGVISYNGGTSTTTIVTIPAYGSVDIAVKSDILDGTSGQTIGVALTQINGMAFSGLSGNLFQIASKPGDLATAQFAAAASVLPATGSTDPLKDTIVWQDQLTVSNKNVWLKSFALRQTNSINMADVSNFRLFVDGTQVAQVQNLDANGYVTFNPVSPVSVLTGSRTIKVLADITGGTSRKLTMSLRSSADVQLTDSNYGSGVSATLASGTFPLNAGDLSINSGSIVVQRDTSSPSGNIVKGSSDAVLGRWLFTAYGEPTKVSTLIAGLRDSNVSTANLRNGRIMAYPVGQSATAQQYGSTTNLLTSTTASQSYTTNLIVNPGTPMMVEVRADIYDNDGTDNTTAGDTLTATLYPGSSNGQGMVSLTTSNVPSGSSSNAASQLTIQSGSATISKYANFPDQQITAPRTGAKIGDFVVTGGTTEAINVNTLTLDVTVGAGLVIGNLSNVYLKFNGVPTSTKSSVTATGNTYSVSAVLAANSSVHVEVFADLSNITAGATATIQSKLAVSGTTTQSAQTVNTQSTGLSSTSAASTFNGQTMTVNTGTVTSALDAGTPVAKNITANTTADVSKFNFVASNDSFTISELRFKTAASSSEQGIMNVVLKKADGTVVATLPLNLSGASQFATFGGLSLAVLANDQNGLTLTAQVVTGNVGINAATTGLNVALTLDYFKNAPSSTGVIATDNNDRVGNNIYLYNALPVVTSVALPTTLLSTGTQSIAKFSIATQGAANAVTGWNTVLLTVAKTSGPNIASSGMQLFEDGIDVSANVVFNSLHIGTSQTSGWIILRTNNSGQEFQIPVAGHTYELKANVTNTTTADSINLTIGNPSAHIATNQRSVMALNTASASFVWTDRTKSGHSITTGDWQNDYLIKNLPFTQSLSR